MTIGQKSGHNEIIIIIRPDFSATDIVCCLPSGLFCERDGERKTERDGQRDGERDRERL